MHPGSLATESAVDIYVNQRHGERWMHTLDAVVNAPNAI